MGSVNVDREATRDDPRGDHGVAACERRCGSSGDRALGLGRPHFFGAALIIDALGMLDKAFPMIDVVWAPLSSALLKKMFNSNTGAALQLFEESVPGFDWVPTATITRPPASTKGFPGAATPP